MVGWFRILSCRRVVSCHVRNCSSFMSYAVSSILPTYFSFLCYFGRRPTILHTIKEVDISYNLYIPGLSLFFSLSLSRSLPSAFASFSSFRLAWFWNSFSQVEQLCLFEFTHNLIFWYTHKQDSEFGKLFSLPDYNNFVTERMLDRKSRKENIDDDSSLSTIVEQCSNQAGYFSGFFKDRSVCKAKISTPCHD